ncbi:MAG: hypothetical protein OXT74_19090 [Candidatus Poribacteria bacterium]|nr:hypothetical protein [Candidatus Poribacteria bacterium]
MRLVKSVGWNEHGETQLYQDAGRIGPLRMPLVGIGGLLYQSLVNAPTLPIGHVNFY